MEGLARMLRTCPLWIVVLLLGMEAFVACKYAGVQIAIVTVDWLMARRSGAAHTMREQLTMNLVEERA